MIIDLDGPILNVVPRYWAAHEEALVATGAKPLVANVHEFWSAKRRAEPVVAPEHATAYTSLLQAIIERDDLLRLDRLQPASLVALGVLAARSPTVVLSLRTNQPGALAAVERLGITAVVPVFFVAHGSDGKVARARALAAAHCGGVLAVIGDSEADAAAARALGAPFWAVTCGIREEARLRAEGAVRVAASLTDYSMFGR